MVFDQVINGFSTNAVMGNLHIFNHSIITSLKRGFYLRFSSTSYVGNLDRFRRVIFERVHNNIDSLKKNSFQEDENKFNYVNELFHNMVLDDLTKWVYHFIFDL